MTDNDYPDSIGVMWPVDFSPNYPFKPVPKMHITNMYLGEMQDVNFDKEELIDRLYGIGQTYFWADVVGTERFGPEQDIPVLRVDHTEIYKVHDEVEYALAAVGIQSASSFPDYKPHVTVDDEIWAKPPTRVWVRALMIWWGNERIKL